MRPHEARSARRRAADARRRLRIRTTWLPGFPVDGRWQAFGPDVGKDPDARVLAPDEVRRAWRALVELPRELGDRVVDDGWTDALRWVLDREDGGAFSGDATERYRPSIRKRFESVPAELAHAIAWWRLFAPLEAVPDLDAAAHPVFAAVLERYGVIAAMRLLRAERTVGLGEIKGWLADRRAYVAPAQTVGGADVGARRNAAHNGLTAAAWWFKQVDAASAHQVRILAAVAPGPAVRDAWLDDRAGYVARLDRIERREIARAAEAPPTSVPLPTFAPYDGPEAAEFARGLLSLPDDARMARLELARMARISAQVASAAAALRAPFPWASVAEHLTDWRVNHALLFEDHPHEVAALLVEPSTPEQFRRACEAVDVAGPAAATLLAGLSADQDVRRARFAVSVTRDPAALTALAAALPPDFDLVESKTLAAAGPTALTRWFAAHQGRRLQAIAALEAVAGKPIPPPPDLTPDPWWTDLPHAFHAAAAEVAKVDPDARTTVRRLLHPAVPDPDTVRAELAWIDAQPEDHERAGSLARRRALLARLLDAPRLPGLQRVANLVADLDRTAWEKRLERWEQHAREVAGQALRGRLGLAGDVGILFDPRWSRVIGGYSDLDRPFRRLFVRVLQARLGPPPWDLRDPANDRLAERFGALGVDLRAWVARDLVHEVETPDGPLRIALEADPLEVLRMGEHFGTCLSPGDMNWFSAVANAADGHRRVAFARAADGTAVGRVLLCLTEQGGLVSFNLYCHRHTDLLEAAMRSYVQALAAKMGTAVVARGRVPLAVAPRWYDDGPDDRTVAWPALDSGSPFRRALATVAPEGLKALVAEAFAPAPPAPVLVGWLAGLPEVHERVDLLRAMLPDAEALSDEDPGKVELYRRLCAAGDRDHVVAWARAHGTHAMRRRWADPPLDWLFDLAVDEFPGKVLQWARDLSWCASCGFEHDAFAAFQAARACIALHRLGDARRYAAASLASSAHHALPARFEEAARRIAP